MNNNFDKILKKKIEQSFQELHVPYESVNWNALREKIESPENYSILFPTFMKIAAVCLVGIALSLYYFSTPEEEMPISNFAELPPTIEQTPPDLSPIDPQQPLANNMAASDNNSNFLAEDDQDAFTAVVNSTDSKAVELMQISNSSLNRKAILPVSITDDSAIVFTKKLINIEPPVESSIIVQKNVVKTREPELSVLAASNIGFSKAENGVPVGISTGFVSAFSLTSKVSVSSGLVISHQDLQIEDSGTNISLESNLGEVQKITRAKLLALDIPVNFRYHFKSSEITSSFLSIGFTSLLYLQQEFNFTTRQVTEEASESVDGSIIISRNISEQHTSSSSPAFSRFDAASMLNISVGFQHTLSSHLDIVFEPYLKYPLGSLTSQNVHYGSGGIQFRIVF